MVKKFLVFVLFSYFSLFTISVSAEETKSPIDVIKNYTTDLNDNQWEQAASWWDKESRKELLDFISNKENQKYKLGLLNIKEANGPVGIILVNYNEHTGKIEDSIARTS